MSEPKGLKYDNAKPDMSLIPAAAALEEAAVWTYGKRKYDAFNWHKGLKFNRILASIERHLTLLKAGQDFDYENNLSNAAAIRCCCAMLIQFTLENRTDLDDRLKLDEATSARITEMCKGRSIFDILNEEARIDERYLEIIKKYYSHDESPPDSADGMSANLAEAASKGFKIP